MLVLAFPTGHIMRMLVAFVVCHIYILAMDHYRVLRSLPAFWFASSKVDSFSQATLTLELQCIVSIIGI